MSGRKNSTNFRLLQAQSMKSSFTTPPTIVQFMDNIGYQINVDANGSSGTFAVEASLDYVPSDPTQEKPASSGTWVPLTLAGGTPTISGSDDTISIALQQVPFKALRLSYTSSVAGTGVCDIWVNVRQI